MLSIQQYDTYDYYDLRFSAWFYRGKFQHVKNEVELGATLSNTTPIPAEPSSSTTAATASSTSLFRPSAPQLRNMGISRFFDLPLEIRHVIYTLTLTFLPVPSKSKRKD